MSDLRELAAYTQAHPDDRQGRWRLAKVLYTACEYPEALRHLERLRREWPEHLNIARYLAATYYRLGRYDEAVAHLEGMVGMWPGEIPLREQLARVYEMAGRREQAARVWEDIVALDGHHPMAALAVRRLRSVRASSAMEDLQLEESNSGISLSEFRVCPVCGAQNGIEFDRCWQCHALLPGEAGAPLTPTPTPAVQRASTRRTAASPFLLAAVPVMLLTFAAAVYFLLHEHMVIGHERSARIALHTVRAVLASELFVGRIVLFGLLLVVWPFAVWAGLRAVDAADPPAGRVPVAGLLAATAACLATAAPMRYIVAAAVVPCVLALGLALVAFGLSTGRAVAVWAIQMAIVVVTVLVVLVSFMGFGPALEIPFLVSYGGQHDSGGLGIRTVAPGPVPARFTLRWHTSGSAWLDSRGRDVSFEIERVGRPSELRAELKRGDDIILREDITQTPQRTQCRIAPGSDFDLRVTGPEGSSVSLRLYGVLPVDL